MTYFHVSPKIRTYAKLHISATILHRIFSIYTHDSALRILSVKSALRSAQHIDACDIIEVRVVCALAYNGNIIDINAHRRVVYP